MNRVLFWVLAFALSLHGLAQQRAKLASGASIIIPAGYQQAENKPNHQDWTDKDTGRSIRFRWEKRKGTLESDVAFARKRKRVVKLKKLDYPAYLFFPREGSGFYGSSVRLSVYGPEGITKVHFLNPRKTDIKGFEKEATRVARSFKKSK